MMKSREGGRRGAARHGSCGKGIGETVAFSLEFPTTRCESATADPNILRRKLTGRCPSGARRQVGWAKPDVDAIVGVYTDGDGQNLRRSRPASLAARGRLIFEGAQGVLLDEWRGFHPHTTWSTVEPSNARAMIRELGRERYVSWRCTDIHDAARRRPDAVGAD